ncbi:MAG: filamentous hemagglutinin N-terminal domain-containing protein, partial [Alphaproteobacteria bacterium]|nr:filamentous hemagglutinin N-terminal domain-containing protein [Alphaproteobacteria bacterium]
MASELKTLLMTTAAIIALCTPTHKVMASPEGGLVVGGSANISRNGTKTDIYQQSNKAILDWRSFDIGAQEHVQFYQPSPNAIALNRIRDTKASKINGRLTANGHVMLINPNGIVFGASSQVDVGALTATTADIDNNGFMAGKLNFNKAGKLDASIINHGAISVKDAGLVNLVAPHVENHGVIAAKLGKIQLAAADTFTLDMVGDGLLQVALTDEQAKKLVRNTGRISAEGGTIALTASRARRIVDSLVENTGIIEAHSMTKVGGKVILGGSHAKISGSINVNGKM